MNFIKKNLFHLVLIAFLIITPTLSFAVHVNGDPIDPPSSNSSVKLDNPIKADSINGFIKDLLQTVLTIGMPIVALAVIYSGFLFVSARGNSEKLTQAKSALMYTLIGAAILLGSWSIALLIDSTVRAL